MLNFNDMLDCVCQGDCCYILKKSKTIELYENRRLTKVYKIEDDFDLLTYDAKAKCFYLGKRLDNTGLYKSIDFKEYTKINLNLPLNCLEKIKHITYCQAKNAIIITTKRRLFSYNFINKKISLLLQIQETKKYNDCLSPLGKDCLPELIGAVCCGNKLYVAYYFENCSYLAPLCDGKLGEIVFSIQGIIKNLCLINQEIWLLIDNGCTCELVCTNIECDCPNEKGCDENIICSIAAIEKSLAKIIESESLKIKTAIKKTDDIKDLLAVNCSVKDMIYYITILEFILTEKLKSTKKGCGEC